MTFECPRCHAATDDTFYGPCTSCRSALRTTMAGEQHDLEVVDYVPKMNVTPNAVATKD